MAVVELGPGDRLGDHHQPRAVNDGVDPRLQRAAQRARVEQVALHQPRAGGHGRPVALAEVVEDGHLVSSLDGHSRADAPDVTRTARDQQPHRCWTLPDGDAQTMRRAAGGAGATAGL